MTDYDVQVDFNDCGTLRKVNLVISADRSNAAHYAVREVCKIYNVHASVCVARVLGQHGVVRAQSPVARKMQQNNKGLVAYALKRLAKHLVGMRQSVMSVAELNIAEELCTYRVCKWNDNMELAWY